MKKGYKRLLLFFIILIILLLINTFAYNFLSRYKMILFLIILLLVFNKIFVIEKDRHRYLKEVFFEILIFFITFFMLYFLLGLFVGLARTPNYLTFTGIKDIILPIVLNCILLEILRYNFLCKAEGNKLCTVISVIIITIFYLTNDYYFTSFNSAYDTLRFIALILLPTISKNVAYSYVSSKIGYKPVIVFNLVFSLFAYILPLVPNPNEYIVSIIYLIVPIIFALRILRFFNLKKDDLLPSNYHKIKFKAAIIPCILILVMIYFYSGYFRFYIVAIASGSMEPGIKKGDVVVVDQKYSFDTLNEDQVIAFRKENVIVVHRIVKKVKLGDSYLYYTKGDANDNMDDFVIEEDMIIGKVNYKISYIGYPTVWLSER